MKSKKTPRRQSGGNAKAQATQLAREIEAIRTTDPAHHARIMRKLAQLERRSAG